MLYGEHDLAASPSLSDVLTAIPRPRDARVIIDLSTATFIDSTVLNAIARHDAAGNPMVLRAPRGSAARRALDLCDIGHTVAIYETLADAMIALHRHSQEPASIRMHATGT